MEMAPLTTGVSLSLPTIGATPCSETSLTTTCIWDATSLGKQRWWKTRTSTTQTLKLFLFLTDMMWPYSHNAVVVGCCCCCCCCFGLNFTADECILLSFSIILFSFGSNTNQPVLNTLRWVQVWLPSFALRMSHGKNRSTTILKALEFGIPISTLIPRRNLRYIPSSVSS